MIQLQATLRVGRRHHEGLPVTLVIPGEIQGSKGKISLRYGVIVLDVFGNVNKNPIEQKKKKKKKHHNSQDNIQASARQSD